jgi:hypothetical protein
LPLELQKSALKIAALAVGDPSIVRTLPDLIPSEENERSEAISELIEFSVSEEFASIRRKTRLA